MANPNRAMARLVRIDAIDPIEGADRIMAAHVGGWTVVVGKGDFEAGDLAVFFEIDSFLPADDFRYEKFAERGVKEMLFDGAMRKGHVLRTVRLRGVYSQGLLMRPQDVLPESIPEHAYEQMFERKVNLTTMCGVREYEPIRAVDQGNMHILRKYDPYIAPRTDALRIQNVGEDVFSLMKKTRNFISVKVDGTSITMVNDLRYQAIRVFSHNNELGTDGGFGKQVYNQAEEQGIVEWLDEHPNITLQMEAVGPKINGNRLGLKNMKLFVFSVWSIDDCRYFDPYELFPLYCIEKRNSDIMRSLVPRMPLLFLLSDYPTTGDLIERVDGIRGHVTDRLDEGIVIHILSKGNCTDDEWRRLRDELGAQMQVKVISNKYLLKAKG